MVVFSLDSDLSSLLLFPPTLLRGKGPYEKSSLIRIHCPPLPLLD